MPFLRITVDVRDQEGDKKSRLIAKFFEGEYEKTDRLMELWEKYFNAVKVWLFGCRLHVHKPMVIPVCEHERVYRFSRRSRQGGSYSDAPAGTRTVLPSARGRCYCGGECQMQFHFLKQGSTGACPLCFSLQFIAQSFCH